MNIDRTIKHLLK